MESVSAIITTHNRANLLARAIESVINQTYKNIECIVVDDASTDDTHKVCQQYPVQYVFIPKEESRGGNYARNLGIKAAKGKFCAFLDDDDYWLPTKIEKQVSLIEEKGCEMVHCGRRLEYVTNSGIRYVDTVPDTKRKGDMSRSILWTICTTTTNMLVLRQALVEIGMFDENLRFWQEYELSIRLAQRAPFYFVEEPLSVYRIDEQDKNRLTNKFFEWKKSVKFIYHKHEDLFNQLSLLDRLKVKSLYWRDAMNRTRLSGMRWRHFLYKTMAYPSLILIKLKLL